MGPLEFIYYLGYSFKKSVNLKNRKRLPHKVISVGNLTLGGTGKTPAVIALAEEAGKRGFQPCVLTRGYKGKKAGPCFVSRGEGALLNADEAGDEALLMADRLDGVPVVKGKDRYEAGMFAVSELSSHSSAFNLESLLFILDDGFQHWKLHRDKDILLIDGTNPFGNGRLFPSGTLREPLSEMKRADVIVITKIGPETAGQADMNALTGQIRKYNPDAPMYSGGHNPVCLRTQSGDQLPLDAISGRKVYFFCGIADPSSFRKTLLRMNADVKGSMTYGDHHRYSPRDILQIREAFGKSGADWIVTTEKDIIKLADFGQAEKLVAMRVEFKADAGFYDKVFAEE